MVRRILFFSRKSRKEEKKRNYSNGLTDITSHFFTAPVKLIVYCLLVYFDGLKNQSCWITKKHHSASRPFLQLRKFSSAHFLKVLWAVSEALAANLNVVHSQAKIWCCAESTHSSFLSIHCVTRPWQSSATTLQNNMDSAAFSQILHQEHCSQNLKIGTRKLYGCSSYTCN